MVEPGRGRLRLVVPRYGETVVGGSEALARTLARELASRGWEIEVWTTTATDEATWRGSLPEGPSEEDGIRVRRFALARYRRPAAFHQLSRAFFRLPAPLRPERFWLRAQGPYAPQLLRALATATGGPTLFTPYLFHPTVLGLRAAPRPRLLVPAAHDERALRLRLVGEAVAASDAILYHSPEERDLLERVHPVAAQRPHAVGSVGVSVPGPVPASRFRQEEGIAGPYLLYGGRIATGKGVEMLLDGARRLHERRPEARLVLAGEAGGLVPPDPWVIAVGRLSSERWADAVAGAAAVVSPGSLESLSLLVLEAWAAGRPCLVNAASPVLRGQAQRAGGALLYSNAVEFVEVADRLLGDGTLRDRLGASGQAHVLASYGWDGVERRLRELIAAAQERLA